MRGSASRLEPRRPRTEAQSRSRDPSSGRSGHLLPGEKGGAPASFDGWASAWITRVITLRFGTFALLASLLAAAPLHAASRPPNVVIIFADDLGYADVGCFGATGFATPNLDRLARGAAVHQLPRRPAGLLGLAGGAPDRLLSQPHRHPRALGPEAEHGIADGETTLAEMLKQKGYATGMAGKWHLGHHPRFLPVHHGFDEYLGLPYSNDMWPHHPEAKPGAYPPLPLIEGETIIDAEVSPEDQRRLTTQYTERAVSFIERHKDGPFFFYLAHSMPHVPLAVSDRFLGKSEQGLYGDVIMEIDWSVGEVLKALETHDLERDTLVIFTSDNGPWLSYGEHAGSAGPLREGKGTCWEGGVRVPCIMRLPGEIPAGTTSDAMLMTIDLAPHDRPARRRRPPRARDRRPRRLAAARGAARGEEPARRLPVLLREERAPGRGERRRALEAATAPHLYHPRRPPRRPGRDPVEVREADARTPRALRPAARRGRDPRRRRRSIPRSSIASSPSPSGPGPTSATPSRTARARAHAPRGNATGRRGNLGRIEIDGGSFHGPATRGRPARGRWRRPCWASRPCSGA